MNPDFPILIPERLPIRITPCPIVEAAFEVRFNSTQPWENMPGLLCGHIQERYPRQERLPMADIPEEVRRQAPFFQPLPLLQFLGDDFLIQIGPRCLSLVTHPNAYPGWEAIREELRWLVDKAGKAGFIGETERIGVRYIDFFQANVFENLQMQLVFGEHPSTAAQTEVTTILRRAPMTIRLHATNAAIAGGGESVRSGSVLDVDAWFGALEADLFVNGMDRFAQAHQAIKGLFFGLMKPHFLATLKPEYS
jgi:uncharacterized protein (TIGR04255 family)